MISSPSYRKIKGDKVYLYHGIVAGVIYGLLGPPPPGLLRHNCYNKVLTRIYRQIRFITFVRESGTDYDEPFRS